MRKVSLKTIERRIEALRQQADRLREREKGPAIREIVSLMRKHGISLPDLRAQMGGRRGRKKASPTRGRKIKPLYRNPKTGETWTGRGRPARWIAAAEKAGRKRSEFLIKKS